MSRHQQTALVLSALGFVSVGLIDGTLPAPSWLQTSVVMLFLLFGAGVGWVGMLRLGAGLVSFALTVSTSLAFALLVATALAVLDVWSAALAFALLATVSVVGTAAWVVADRRAVVGGDAG